MKKIGLLILLPLVCLVDLVAQTTTSEVTQPTAVFSAVFWGTSGTRSLVYAPWGNFDEENATKSMVRVVNGALSKKFVYYGQNNPKFYQKRNFTELELESMEDKTVAEEVSFFSEVPFSPTAGETKEFIILFSPTQNKSIYKSFLVPFDDSEIPWGSYKLFSRVSEPLYIAAGKMKFSLDPGKSKILHSKDFEGLSRAKMLIYKKINGIYAEEAAQSFNVTERQRGMFFFSETRNIIDVVPMVESNRPINHAIGFNTKPKEIEVKEEEIKNAVPQENF